ncbi:hypothetical protein [Brachybacterium aquaticum]|uniref:Antitoxin (DNA-binding transcriptional repressor) of toxin-antitoxin stability system n=1 Tax=Brachybacterium aquaticum TaxID=1432564 RepID=A0A841AC75_9MICO|nr:hypothetical protein [Brachybacterium aquaticum]MBB5832839.1 antitoxin (DNA-binding transcriptional repressor) of toxin-antitoxin stability system [Brachybacterium aquaticum]
MEPTVDAALLGEELPRILTDVQAGRSWTVSEEGEAFARIVPHHGHRWVAIEEVAALLAELGANPEWEQELRAE